MRWRRRIIFQRFNYGCQWGKKLYLHLPLLVTHASVLSTRLLIQRLCGNSRRYKGKTSSARTSVSFQQKKQSLPCASSTSIVSILSIRSLELHLVISLANISSLSEKSSARHTEELWCKSPETLQHSRVTQTSRRWLKPGLSRTLGVYIKLTSGSLLPWGHVCQGWILLCRCLYSRMKWRTDDFTMSIEELVVRAVLRVSGDALHPPLWNTLVRRTPCEHTEHSWCYWR